MGSNEQCGIGLVGIGKIASRVGLVGELSSLTHRLRTAGCVQVLVLLSLAGCLCNCGTSNVVAGPPTLASIALTPGNASIAAGTTKQFTATGTYSNGSTQNLTSAATWKSSVPGVATISAAGLATTAAKGASSISATMGSITGSTTLTVTAPTLVSIAVTPGNPSIAAGTMQQFTATGTYSDGSTQNLTSAATWSSSASGVATISAAGLAASAAKGASSISATMGSIRGSTTLTVTAPTLVSIAVTPTNPSIAAGTTRQFTATGTYSDGSTQNLTSTATWSSSAPGVATISAAGLATSLAKGTSSISATMGSISGSTTLTVTAPVLVSIAVTPANPSIAVGEHAAVHGHGNLQRRKHAESDEHSDVEFIGAGCGDDQCGGASQCCRHRANDD